MPWNCIALRGDNIVTCQLHLKWIKMAKQHSQRTKEYNLTKELLIFSDTEIKFIDNFVCKCEMAKGAHWIVDFYLHESMFDSFCRPRTKQILIIYGKWCIWTKFVESTKPQLRQTKLTPKFTLFFLSKGFIILFYFFVYVIRLNLFEEDT